ncbi:MAG: hypothetical protein ABSB29_03885 [Nitrososphaerales archaeon]
MPSFIIEADRLARVCVSSGYGMCEVLGTQIVWVEAGVAVGLLVAAVCFLLSLGKLIKREKLLP